jgi:GNAT superfamily N-acetyltransferase
VKDATELPGVRFVWLDPDDELMAEADELRYRALLEPFGVEPVGAWSAEGEDVRHLGAVESGRLVGYGCLVAESGSGRLRQLAVEESCRGRGIGSALVERLVDAAEQLGLRPVWLHARVAYESFYRRRGFAPIGGTFPYGATGLPHVRMERSERAQGSL